MNPSLIRFITRMKGSEIKMKINTKGLDPRSLCMDDVFIRVLKAAQKDKLEEDEKRLKHRSSGNDIFKWGKR